MREKIERIGSYAFYLGIVLETLYVIIDKSAYVLQHPTLAFRFTALLFGIKILTTKYSKKEWIGIALAALLGIISWKYTDKEEVARVAILIIACKNVDMKKTLKIILWETVAGIVTLMILAFAGILGVVSLEGYFRGGGIIHVRYCFGLGHPNVFHGMLTMIMLLFLALYDEKMKWWGYAICMVLNIIAMLYTDSRTGFLITVAIIIVATILHYATALKEGKIIWLVTVALLIFEVAYSVFAAFVGVKEVDGFLWKLDEKLNGRMWWAHVDGSPQYWSLFSSSANTNLVDMGFVKMIYWYGIIPSIVFGVILVLTIRECAKTKHYDYILIIIGIMLYTLMEAHVVCDYIGANYTYLCMGAMLPLIINHGEKINGRSI